MKRNQNFLMMSLLMMAFSLGGCNLQGQTLRGDGNLERLVLKVDQFHTIDLTGIFNVILEPGNNPEVILETDANLMDMISVESRNNILRIRSAKDVMLRPTRMDLYITYSQLEKIILGGACKVSSPAVLETPGLVIDISGAASIDLEVNTAEMYTHSSGACNINLEGNAAYHRLELSGASNLRADQLLTRDTDIRMSGAGSARVHASDQLKANISGMGSVRYSGNPEHTILNKSGIGTIRSIH